MKLTPSFVLALAAASSASAVPLFKRQVDAGNSTTPSNSTSTSSSGSASNSTSLTLDDTQILQYALTLEHLEATFYNQSLSNLSSGDFESAGYNASVRNQIYSIGQDEASHVRFLTTALGDRAVPPCTYDFSSVTDVDSFLATARVLEGVGVSAYLGAARNITDKNYLEAAGSILTVESRHASYLIAQTNDGGNAIPAAFDTPLDFSQVYSLAAPFIASCPDNATLPITAFPALTLSADSAAGNGSFTPGQQITVTYANSTNTTTDSSAAAAAAAAEGGENATTTYIALIQGPTQPQFVELPSNGGSITLPSNLTGGQMYAVVTSSNDAVTDDNTIAGPAVGYVSIPLPQAPEATNASSSASASASGSSTETQSAVTGGAAGATGGATASSAATATEPTSASSSVSLAGPTADSIISSAPASASASASQDPLAGLGSSSANAAVPTSST
ncbi:hypothetical protein BCV70DRAFT_109368 [Testicularia cyperi]|uniref:Ferritin-like protein n=1 Tax=Testicularia cyperi TaxID=1882483 RepID=A0A317XF60_9BASI|nr:hypothetical protein BCV70DRAFT_109368 [Testicularia cyperi]